MPIFALLGPQDLTPREPHFLRVFDRQPHLAFFFLSSFLARFSWSIAARGLLPARRMLGGSPTTLRFPLRYFWPTKFSAHRLHAHFGRALSPHFSPWPHFSREEEMFLLFPFILLLQIQWSNVARTRRNKFTNISSSYVLADTQLSFSFPIFARRERVQKFLELDFIALWQYHREHAYLTRYSICVECSPDIFGGLQLGLLLRRGEGTSVRVFGNIRR